MRKGISKDLKAGLSWDCVQRRKELQEFGTPLDDPKSDDQSFKVNYDRYPKACDPRFDLMEGKIKDGAYSNQAAAE